MSFFVNNIYFYIIMYFFIIITYKYSKLLNLEILSGKLVNLLSLKSLEIKFIKFH